jgi:D-alanine-D-alanine ligase-like ATP-grasp enzyme
MTIDHNPIFGYSQNHNTKVTRGQYIIGSKIESGIIKYDNGTGECETRNTQHEIQDTVWYGP